MKTVIKNANLVMKNWICFGGMQLEDGKITKIVPGCAEVTEEGVQEIDAKNLYVSPGFVDLHTHGAGGDDYLDGTRECIVNASMAHMAHGTTTLLPTTTAGTMDEVFELIENFKYVQKNMKDGPNLPGLHLEGPYFSYNQRGAQDPRFIKDPDPREYQRIIKFAKGAVARWSVAPELSGAMEMGDYLAENNILASIAHSEAEYDDVLEASRHGYTHVTHLYSGTSTIVRKDGFRHLGIVESAYILEDMTVELIADGCHLPPPLLRMVYRCKGPDKVCLVTDSMRGAGMPEGKSILGGLKNGQAVIIEDGVAKLPDHTAFAGSVATADRLVRVMHQEAGVPLWDCITMMSATPAKIIKQDNKGILAKGMDADLTFFDEKIKIHRVMVAGNTTYTL